MVQLIDFILHIDVHLAQIVKDYGTWTYLILFMLIFCETGLVITPFLPGDSLLFVIGAFGATGTLDIRLSLVLLIIAAVGGNITNYFIGRIFGQKILDSDRIPIVKKIIKKEYIEKTHAFYEKHGGKAILFSRFFPILRTFAPFVAGIGGMSIPKFMMYNAVGGISWVSIVMFCGFFFGNIPFVKENFTYVVFAIIIVSVLPAVITAIKARGPKVKK